jgi:hypothetical protein
MKGQAIVDEKGKAEAKGFLNGTEEVLDWHKKGLRFRKKINSLFRFQGEV